jgi:hypothetical protein
MSEQLPTPHPEQAPQDSSEYHGIAPYDRPAATKGATLALAASLTLAMPGARSAEASELVPRVETGVETEHNSVVTTEDTLHLIDTPHRHDFRTTPEDSDIAGVQIRQFLEENKDTILGSDAYKFTVRGIASAEDDSPDGGLDTDSPKNVELAAERAEITRQQLDEQSKDVLGVGAEDEITSLEAHEDELSEEQITTIEEMTERFGYTKGVKGLVEQFNSNPDAVPPEAELFLPDVLKRGAEITLETTKTEEVVSEVPAESGVKEVIKKEISETFDGTVPIAHKATVWNPDATPRLKRGKQDTYKQTAPSQNNRTKQIKRDIQPRRSNTAFGTHSQSVQRAASGRKGYSTVRGTRGHRG